MICMEISVVTHRKYPQLSKLYKSFKVTRKGEICLAIGGDGTFVRAAKEFDGPILPIRSDEKGSIGYYSDLSLKDMDFVISSLKDHKFTVEKLGSKIELAFRGRNYYAVNEVLLHNVAEEVSFKIYEIKGGKRAEIYPYVMSGDGILITGSIGSTAYNKSAGGPIILTPDAICMTFLNVDGPYKNPIVIGSSKIIEIEIMKYRGVLRFDGTEVGQVKPGDRIRIMVSDKELRVVRFEDRREELAKKLDRIIRSRMTS